MLSIGHVDHIDVSLWSSYLSINLLSGYTTRKIGLCMVVPTGTLVLSDDVYIFLGHFFQQSCPPSLQIQTSISGSDDISSSLLHLRQWKRAFYTCLECRVAHLHRIKEWWIRWRSLHCNIGKFLRDHDVDVWINEKKQTTYTKFCFQTSPKTWRDILKKIQ